MIVAVILPHTPDRASQQYRIGSAAIFPSNFLVVRLVRTAVSTKSKPASHKPNTYVRWATARVALEGRPALWQRLVEDLPCWLYES